MNSDRKLLISGPFGATEVSVEHLQFFESLGTPFLGELSLVSPSPDLDISSVVGKTVTIAIDLEGGLFRYVNAYVTSMALIGTFERQARYHATLRPWFFLLSGRKNSRIFEEQSVVDIATALFREHGFSDFEDELDGTYAPADFVVQYDESDFAFVSRLLEKAGIYYYFKQEDGRHVLVLTDSLSGSDSPDGYATVPFHPEGTSTPGDDEFISAWQVVHQWKTGAVAVKDFDFTKPKATLLAQLQAQARHEQGDYEAFEYPAGYSTAGDGTTYARVLLEEAQAEVEVVHGSGSVQGLGTGDIFTLIDHPSDAQNKEYLLISSAFDVSNTPHDGGAAGGDDSGFQFTFSAIDSKTPFRPAQKTPRARVRGPQTAIVVGPSDSDDDIWVDKYGRVKVQFHWDRESKASCWVRVSQAWAGAKWGSMHIPRIGQEVIVDFLEGDPDRPIITGRVYNDDQMPPYDLPDNKTQSGIKSRSTPKGNSTNFNEIRFEDKKGSEELFIQAEKTQTTKVKGSQSISVAGSRSISVGGDESTSVTGTRSATITKKETQTFKADREMKVTGTNLDEITGAHTGKYHAGRTETVESGDTLTVMGSDKTVTVHGNYNTTADTQFQVTQGANSLLIKNAVDVTSEGEIHLHNKDCSVDLKAGKVTITAANELTLVCGGASISLKSDGSVQITGSQKVAVSGGDASLDLSAQGAELSGTKAKVSGSAVTEISGAIVKIN